MNTEKHLIFNADDFGLSAGVNRGILDCYLRGVVTSTSLMVTGRAVTEAVAMSRDNPNLAVGLHWDVWGEDEREFDITDIPLVRDEFRRQFDMFEQLLGRPPTHVDSHRHAHRSEKLMPVFLELVHPLGIPLRCDGKVRFWGGFYAQWEWKVTDLHYVSSAFLIRMLQQEVKDGWTEFSCHPGYASSEDNWVYGFEREREIAALTDPIVRTEINKLHIRLASYADYANFSRTELDPGNQL